MIKYHISAANELQHIFSIQMEIPTNGRACVKVQLPAWRPGRYELANFAKNILQFEAFDDKGTLSFQKLSKDLWEIQCNHCESIRIAYTFYANELNAGSTYLDEHQWYMNPVNCLLYDIDNVLEKHEVTLDIPKGYVLASPIKKDAYTLLANSFDHLADSPFIASEGLQLKSYVVEEVIFNIWFQGAVEPDWEKLISHFKAFTIEQMECFGSIPCNEYHFLFEITPYKHYHGVEHGESTVIALGPDSEIMEGERYLKLLGVSSHELYHTWNIKAIRPIDMYPYDFSKENYTKLGYVAEGVTTYMGDMMLFRSKVFSWEEFVETQNENFKKHFDNFGRYNMSVADSSFDTWLDGYVMGAPNRKVSIYTEGALNMLMIDLSILKHSKGKESLHSVMRYMYEEYALKSKGYTEGDFRSACLKFGGQDLQIIFDNHINGTVDFKADLQEKLNIIGLNVRTEEQKENLEACLGIKTVKVGDREKVIAVSPDSDAYVKGVAVGDFITYNVEEFKEDCCTVEVEDLFETKKLSLSKGSYYPLHTLEKQISPSAEQKSLFEIWSKNAF